MNQERLETLKALYRETAPNLTLDLIAEIERLRGVQSLSGVTKTMAKFVAEIERLQAKCNALIDALGESDYASYYPWLADREPSPDSHRQTNEAAK